MATVSLQTVFDEAHRALETGAADKAIGIAQHILAHFPRMIEGYRLLGEAHLNASQSEQAAAAFERVLQADPENVAAYYGLGLARQSLDQRSAAITAFERALEIQPNLADLRTQLMRLYSETPGSAGQFRLSRAGLGRLYARGGMFGQAIDEFRAVLDADPSRDDVKAALAEALWRDGQEDEAMEFCRDVLDRQPDLLKPTVLLGYLLFATGHPEGETLWRRAAEQDATMTLARSLFDILPPIRLEEPVLPEFDEAEWRAKEARRVAEQPVPAAATAAAALSTSAEDDFFADSWLASAGATNASAQNTRIYEAQPNAGFASAGAASDDDDLLASLLGFASAEPEPAPTTPARDRDQLQPFGFDWGDDTQGGQPSLDEPLPSSLDNVGMFDAETAQRPSADVADVKPFSFDDWDLGSDLPTAQTPAPTASEDELDFPDIEAFSLDDDTSGKGGKLEPFSFDAEDTVPEVKPFSLEDDLGDFGGVAPFSFEEEGVASGNAPAPADAGLGQVQPFSLDDWGLDDDASGLKPLSADELGADEEKDEFGGFKPFSLDELSLDSLEGEAGSSLSGPHISSEDEESEERSGFSWQEPSWRTQTTQSERSESIEGESIFAKLMRNRPPEQTPPAEEAAEEDAEDEPMSFFSLDDEPLRLDLDDDQDLQAAQPSQPDLTAPAQEMPGGAAAEQIDLGAATDSAGFFALDELESEQGFSWETPGASQSPEESPTSDSAGFFALDELESEQGFSWETPGASQPSEPAAEQDTQPFSLSDLGLSDEELSALDIQSEASGEQQEPEMLPFSLSDLGLSDEEIAALDLQESEPVAAEPTGSEAPALPEDMRSDMSDTAAQPSVDTSAQEPDLTPFSLADLGLNDEELAFLEQAQAEHETGAAADQTAAPEAIPAPGSAADESLDLPSSEFDALFADLNMSEISGDVGAAEQSDSALEELFGDFDLPSAAEAAYQPQETAADQEQAVWGAEQPETPAQASADQVFGELRLDETGEQPAEAATGEQEPDLTPFSLADFGLSDEELTFFEQAQAAEQSAPSAAEAEEAAAAAIARRETAEPIELPDQQAMEPFESPFSLADLDAGSAQESAAQPSGTPYDTTERTTDSDTHAEHALPMDLPEGAQSVASAAEEYHHPAPVQAAAPASSGMWGSAGDDQVSAIRAMLESDPENDVMRLAVARMSQQTSDTAQALDQYKHLIKRGSLLDEVVVDLQDTIADTDDPQMLRRLHRLLGDAYMKQNRFREAMDEYSWTLARSR
ncbi:MAG TPA: tetratricopeptide repeat protein [Herpetosiphonaceae bacterium]